MSDNKINSVITGEDLSPGHFFSLPVKKAVDSQTAEIESHKVITNGAVRIFVLRDNVLSADGACLSVSGRGETTIAVKTIDEAFKVIQKARISRAEIQLQNSDAITSPVQVNADLLIGTAVSGVSLEIKAAVDIRGDMFLFNVDLSTAPVGEATDTPLVFTHRMVIIGSKITLNNPGRPFYGGLRLDFSGVDLDFVDGFLIAEGGNTQVNCAPIDRQERFKAEHEITKKVTAKNITKGVNSRAIPGENQHLGFYTSWKLKAE